MTLRDPNAWDSAVVSLRGQVMHGKRQTLVTLVLFAVMLGSGIVTNSASAAACNLYASPSHRSGNGRLRRPFGSVVKLDQSLAPGQTGCLLRGTYGNINTARVLGKSGSAAQGDITITSYPGQRAKLVGLTELEGSYTVLSGLQIDGSNTQYSSERPGTRCPYPVSNGLEIDGHNDVFQFNNFYQSVPSLRGNGIGVGWNAQANGTIIRYNRIHDLGQCQAYDQMIYLSSGNGVQIYDNWLWNDPHGWGVQVYPDASNADIYDNVIDRAGSGFVVGGSSSVSGNVIEHNVIMNSTGLPSVRLFRGDAVSSCCGLGSGNVFQSNDIFKTPGGFANASGISLAGNVHVNPRFENPAAHDYRVTPGSPLASWGLWNGGLGAIAKRTTRNGHRRAPTR